MWRPRTYGDGTAEAIDHAVKELIDTAFGTASEILARNQSVLSAGAQELLARETLGPDDVARLTAKLDREKTARPPLVAAQ
jgi:cell division protease FtsH